MNNDGVYHIGDYQYAALQRAAELMEENSPNHHVYYVDVVRSGALEYTTIMERIPHLVWSDRIAVMSETREAMIQAYKDGGEEALKELVHKYFAFEAAEMALTRYTDEQCKWMKMSI